MISNPLFDIKFLTRLFEQKEREIFARITALTQEELPIEYIEGKVTGGSINVDGNSAVRRTCNLTMVAQEVNINDFYWGLKNKFKLEIGLKNNFNSLYPDIIWFKQGLYIITSFNTNQNTNNYTITINGKDKMCLLNGDLAGALPHTTDFGIEENRTEDGTIFRNIPIKEIIREAVQNFGNELAHNIIINDIEDSGLELLEYRGDTPLYLFRNKDSDIFINMTLRGSQPCYYWDNDNKEWVKTEIDDAEHIIYDNLIDIDGENESTLIKLDKESLNEYKIAKFEYGSIPGYRLTDLTYAGDLIANVGETLVSVLDKIKNMLGEFEYFYNLDGKFIFQKKRNYIEAPWNSNEINDEVYIDAAVNKSSIIWSFVDGQLVSAFQNTPNLLNLRNDFSVWGTKKTSAGTELDIHMRYAIDKKPTEYFSLIDKTRYSVEEGWDWRELIYRMALDYRRFYHDDDFLSRVAEMNPQYPDGHTGYEQYYIDLEGFWRLLYDPNPKIKYENIEANNILNKENIYIQQYYYPVGKEDLIDKKYNEIFILDNNNRLIPYNKYCGLIKDSTYYYQNAQREWVSTSDYNILKNKNIEDIYLDEGVNQYIKQCFSDDKEKIQFYLKKGEEKIQFENIANELKPLYQSNGEFKSNIEIWEYDIFKENEISSLRKETIYYFKGEYDYYTEEEDNKYWSKQISENPENLLFWFDFLDAEGSDTSKYSVPIVGSRTKAINDKDVKSIYYREIPTTIFQIGEEIYELQTGYTYVQLQNTMENLFTISSKGKSAKERIDELLYNHLYCIENASITTIPIYHLEPNSRILIQDSNSKVNGEYIVNKLTIPLTYNGTMNITATKAVSNIN